MALPAFIASAFPHIARLFAGNAVRAAATQTPKLGLGGIINSAYGNGGMGLVNLGMDVIPLAMDIANNDVGLKSFSSFGGTLLGTKFGGRELNKLGEKQVKSDVLDRAQRYSQAQAKYNARPSVVSGASKPMGSIKDYDIQPFEMRQTKKYSNDPELSKQGYNMPIGFAADGILYSTTAGLNKPKPTDFETSMMQGQSPSPVMRYIQMTGGL